MLPGLRETVEKHGLLASKALGQNFLLDRNITDKITRLSLNRRGCLLLPAATSAKSAPDRAD